MNNHFAKLGDVWKHLLLAEILREIRHVPIGRHTPDRRPIR
jgi:hypothetical protein